MVKSVKFNSKNCNKTLGKHLDKMHKNNYNYVACAKNNSTNIFLLNSFKSKNELNEWLEIMGYNTKDLVNDFEKSSNDTIKKSVYFLG